LTGSNRSLLVLRLHADQLMDLHSLSFLNGERSFSVINSLIAGRDVKLCPVLDSRVEANNQASTRLKRLQRVDHFIFEERGSNDLHVGWPFIRGKLSDGTAIRAPLIFFPVTLEQGDKDWYLKPRKDAGVTFNKSFLLAYSFYNKIKVDEDLLETSFEDLSMDSTVFRTEVYQLLKDKIEINFNPDNFRDELTAFQEFTREEFDDKHHNEGLKLFPEAVLGIFPQAGSQLVPDYIHLLEDGSIVDLEDFFQRKGLEEAARTPVKEEKIHAPFVLDAYQENAIRSVKKGNSIVVQGPPGTGKSQLIANLLADAIASGKRALLVCQKRAALDVVYERLKSIDLGDFLGLVHDFRNDRKEIFAKIARQVEHVDDYKVRNRSIDAIQMERRFFQASRSIDQITEELEGFKTALFNDHEAGLTIKELYLTSNPYADVINVRQEYQYFHFGAVDEFLRKVSMYAGYAARLDAEEYPWRDRKSFATLQVTDIKEIERILREIGQYQQQVSDAIQALISRPMNLEDGEWLRAREDDVMGMIALLKDNSVYHYLRAMRTVPDEETSLLWFSNLERVAMSCFTASGVESSLASAELGKFQEALNRGTRARKNIFRRLRWEFSEHKLWVKRVLAANHLPYNKRGFQVLEERLDARLNLEHQLSSLREKPWLLDMPADYHSRKFKVWFENQKFAIRVKVTFNSLQVLSETLDIDRYTRDEFVTILKKLLAVVQDIPRRRFQWTYYLSPYQVRQLEKDPTQAETYIRLLRRDFDSLNEFDRLKESLKPHERDVVTKLHDHSNQWDYPVLESLFQNSIRLAWIEHIEIKYPILRAVSSGKMDELQTELQRRVAEKQKLSEEILLMRARERVYDGVTYNRLNNRVTYRDLLHQVTKKKKIWPLRKVIGEYTDELFNLLPCWLASPESVSALFPLSELFDIVIFDEASQCFAERGIPAIYRGRQLIVAGDEMQLKPNELYQVRWEDDKEDHPDLEIDSLLDLAGRYLSTVHLQAHYRSRALELIDFSNRYFYGNRLQLLPDREVMNKTQAAIEYCKIDDGVWENYTNIPEAVAVVGKVMEILQRAPRTEIGIVTFNSPQQMLIMDLMEDAFRHLGTSRPPSLFVKNIENVQGDERDVIVFSVGYAPDKKGKMTMQFGTFNLIGGENRLNVAITRARDKVIVVASIWPEQLQTDDAKNDGPKLLKKYLEFARAVDRREFQLRVVRPDTKSPSWYLNERLKSWSTEKFKNLGFETNRLPFSDLHFTKGEEFLGIILTDDSRYLESTNIKDDHAYTPMLLQNKNWSHRMIFSRNYWQDREKLEGELTRFIGSKS
jgi:hypothetical protein